MSVSLQDASEIVCGLLLNGKLSANSVDPGLLFSPYDEVVKALKSGKTTEEIIASVGLSPIQSSIDAVESLNGLSNADWLGILEKTSRRFEVGRKLENYGKKLQKGDDFEWSKIVALADKAQSNQGMKFTPLNEITGMPTPFKKTGFAAIDEHLGGFPEVGQILIGATPGTGKTTLVADLAASWANEHKNEHVAIFTIEMIAAELRMRFDELASKIKNGATDDDFHRILVNDDTDITPEDVINYASTIENLGLVLVDYADLLINGETTESTMAHIYRTFMLGAKRLGCAIVLVCQLSRNYNGGLPRPFHIRYTSLAEALAYMILMLYNPVNDWFAEKDEDILPAVNGMAYILAWKIRGGFRVHKNDNPGAIQIRFSGSQGFSRKSSGRWFSLQKAG